MRCVVIVIRNIRKLLQCPIRAVTDPSMEYHIPCERSHDDRQHIPSHAVVLFDGVWFLSRYDFEAGAKCIVFMINPSTVGSFFLCHKPDFELQGENLVITASDSAGISTGKNSNNLKDAFNKFCEVCYLYGSL